jgi:hypothetical protein
MSRYSGNEIIYPHEYEQASNSYLMALIAIMAGVPLPIINLIASVGFYLASRSSTYFVRWHSIQSALGQLFLLPFNSVAFAWTLHFIITFGYLDSWHNRQSDTIWLLNQHYPATFIYYLIYIVVILLLNILEFGITIYTASRVRNCQNVRWFLLAVVTDRFCSKQSRDPYKI